MERRGGRTRRPKEGEVLVSFEATGLCHSDHHVRTGDLAGVTFPMIGGHEGAGIVQESGPGCAISRWATTWSLRSCRRAAVAAGARAGSRIYATSARSSWWACRPTAPTAAGRRTGTSASCPASAASPSGTVSEASVVKIDDDVPLSRACLLGCGVTTGWGSAVNTADVRPGDTVVVIGCGGIGSGAIQGARLAGAEQIVVVEPVQTSATRHSSSAPQIS